MSIIVGECGIKLDEDGIKKGMFDQINMLIRKEEQNKEII